MSSSLLRPPVGDATLLKQVFGAFPSGVIAVCAEVGGSPTGMAASSFTSVSMDPPLVAVCVQNTSRTWPELRAAPRLGLSVLAAGQDEACQSLSAKEGDRFAGVDWTASEHGAVFLDHAAALFDASVTDELSVGDHTIAVLAAHAVHVEPDRAPLVFHASRLRRLADA